MLSLAVLYLLAARWTHALPLYPDSNLETQSGKIKFALKKVTKEKKLPVHMSIMFLCFYLKIEGLKAVVLKLAAADKLRSQAFVRSEQGVPKPNKRACFWKYCVTN
uniref:Urotensin-related peptide 1 n=1 Tax=Hippocampus comes TaxID=109280 RepID=A0A3Q3DH90_HIPCM